MSIRPIPDDQYDIPDKPESEFWLLAQGAVADYVVPAVPIKSPEHGIMLVVMAEEGPIYLTREQAKAFFNLKDGS